MRKTFLVYEKNNEWHKVDPQPKNMNIYKLKLRIKRRFNRTIIGQRLCRHTEKIFDYPRPTVKYLKNNKASAHCGRCGKNLGLING